MITGRRKSAFHVPVAAIVKGVALSLRRLRRSGYVFGRSDWRCLVNVFRRRTVVKLLTPKFTEATEKSGFGEKWPVDGIFSNFRCEGIHVRTDSRIHAQFRRKRYSGNDETVRGIHHEKRLVFCRFIWSCWSDLAKNFVWSLSPFPFRILCQVFVQIRTVFAEIYPKMCPRLTKISDWSLYASRRQIVECWLERQQETCILPKALNRAMPHSRNQLGVNRKELIFI